MRRLCGNAVVWCCAMVTLLVLVCQSCEKQGLVDVAGPAAQFYYEQLLQGNEAAFVDGQYHRDSISPYYRDQLMLNARMFMARQKKEHHGILRVSHLKTETDTAHHSANVFLVFAYGDSTVEQVVVPMVEHEGLWYLR